MTYASYRSTADAYIPASVMLGGYVTFPIRAANRGGLRTPVGL